MVIDPNTVIASFVPNMTEPPLMLTLLPPALLTMVAMLCGVFLPLGESKMEPLLPKPAGLVAVRETVTDPCKIISPLGITWEPLVV